jgi:hypothetical protein
MKKFVSFIVLGGILAFLTAALVGLAVEHMSSPPPAQRAMEPPIQPTLDAPSLQSVPQIEPAIRLSAQATMHEWHTARSTEKTLLAEEMAAGARALRPNVTGGVLRRCVGSQAPSSERISSIATACALMVR